MLQHVRTATAPSAGSASARTELYDVLSRGPTIGYAMGSPAGPTAGPMAGPTAGPLQAREAQLLLVEASSLLWVPRGARPPAALPLPAAPAIRSLLEAAPEWLGVAYVVTLAGAPLPLRPSHAHSRLGAAGRACPVQAVGRYRPSAHRAALACARRWTVLDRLRRARCSTRGPRGEVRLHRARRVARPATNQCGLQGGAGGGSRARRGDPACRRPSRHAGGIARRLLRHARLARRMAGLRRRRSAPTRNILPLARPARCSA